MGIALADQKVHSMQKQDFWLLYTAEDHRTLADTVHALYYLPENYKLRVLVNGSAGGMMPTSDADLAGRVEVQSKETGTSAATSPFSSADVIIYNHDITTGKGKTPAVMVVPGTKDIESNEWNGFTIPADSPEAVASAVLRIARAAIQ